jgi:hypothetical protein
VGYSRPEWFWISSTSLEMVGCTYISQTLKEKKKWIDKQVYVTPFRFKRRKSSYERLVQRFTKIHFTSHLKEINCKCVVRNTPAKWQLVLYCCASLALTLFTRYKKINKERRYIEKTNH